MKAETFTLPRRKIAQKNMREKCLFATDMLMLEPSSGAETETFPSRTEKQKKNLILDKLLLPQSSEASGKITFFNIFLNSIRSHNPDCTCFLPHRIMAAKKKASGFMTELLSMRWLQFNPAILR